MTAPRIAFVGSCQVGGLGSIASRLLPEAVVESYRVRVHAADQILSAVDGFDLVVTQIEPGHHISDLCTERFEGLAKQALLLPIFRFRGLHPDLIYILDEARPVVGAGTDYHSMIVAASYGLGIPPERVARLFNAAVFAELGYFDVCAAEREQIEKRSDLIGLDLHSLFDRWFGLPHPFMYTFDHPSIEVLQDLCAMTLTRAGLIPPGTSISAPHDALSEAFTAPVFSPLARRLGVPGRDHFQRRVNEGPDRDLPLSDFISASYLAYDTMEPRHLEWGPIPEARRRLEQILS